MARGAGRRSYQPSSQKSGTAAQLSPSRPSQRELTEVGAFAAVLLSLATIGSSPLLGKVSLSFDPQAGRPIPPGSFTQALRINRVADRPFALHPEALRRGGWNNATGSTCSGQCDHQDQRSQERASAPMTSPDISPELLLPESTSVGSRLGSSVPPRYGSFLIAQVPVFLRVTRFSSALLVDAQVTSPQASKPLRHTKWKCESTSAHRCITNNSGASPVILPMFVVQVRAPTRLEVHHEPPILSPRSTVPAARRL